MTSSFAGPTASAREAAGRVALVTGGARRIGRAICEDLAARGWRLAIHVSPRSRDDGAAFVEDLRARGAEADWFLADLSAPEAAGSIIADVLARCGDLHALVNNASRFEPDDAHNFSESDFDAHIAVNLRAPLALAREFYRYARKAEGEPRSVVNIVDQRVLRPTPDFFSYFVSKAALWQATVAMAQALAPVLRVNAVGPGPVLPNVHDGETGFAEEVAALPLRVAPDPQAIAQAVAFLLEARAVTGQMIAVDGGQHLIV